jgi:phosphoribosyl 1,2-cyclic phosphodiesterase
MSLQIASLNSGSNANCYYIGNKNEAVLIDAGLSCRETDKRMKRLGLDIRSVKAIFISHEHADHIAGLRVLSKKYSLPVYITQNTLRNSNLEIEKVLHFLLYIIALYRSGICQSSRFLKVMTQTIRIALLFRITRFILA